MFWPNVLAFSEESWREWFLELNTTREAARDYHFDLVHISEWNRLDDTLDDPAWLSLDFQSDIWLRLELHPKGPICWMGGPEVEVSLADDIGGQGERHGLRLPELLGLVERASGPYVSNPAAALLLLCQFVSLVSEAERQEFELRLTESLAAVTGLRRDSAGRIAGSFSTALPLSSWWQTPEGWYTDDPESARYLVPENSHWPEDSAERHARDALLLNRLLAHVLGD